MESLKPLKKPFNLLWSLHKKLVVFLVKRKLNQMNKFKLKTAIVGNFKTAFNNFRKLLIFKDKFKENYLNVT
jgi:hypothetical protein